MNSATLIDIAMSHSDSIIEKAQGGDKSAFNKLVGLWYKRIYNFCYKYFNDHDLASEASQRTFISAFKNLNGLKDSHKFKGWIYTVALNFCRDEERRKGSKSKLIVVNSEKQEHYIKSIPDSSNRQPDTLIAKNEISEMVLNAIKRLTEEQREVVIMKEYEGLKFREIAEILSISENTVKSRLYYGFSNLKKIIEKEQVYQESFNHE